MGIFSVLNFFIIISFLFMGGFLFVGVSIVIADSFSYGTQALIEILASCLIVPVIFEFFFILSSIILSFIFYIPLSGALSYKKLLTYIIYYINWLFLSSIVAFITLMTWGSLLVIIFIIKSGFKIKNKTVLEMLNWIPQKLKNKAMQIKEEITYQVP